jgi:hypothetical protein
MKFWNSYGSEHSANLVMVGHFQSRSNAEEAQAAIDQISKYLTDSQESYEDGGRYSSQMLDLLMNLKIHSIQPRELDQFTYDVSTELKEDKIIVTTDESDISAFLKILIEFEAKVEVYSAHTYKGTGEGR